MTICVHFHVWVSGKERQPGLPQVRCEEVACSGLFFLDETGPFHRVCAPPEETKLKAA